MGIYFCREVFGFCCKAFGFAVRSLVLRWGFWFCREVNPARLNSKCKYGGPICGPVARKRGYWGLKSFVWLRLLATDWVDRIDLLACMFCFPITDHVMVPKRTVSFNCRLMHVHPRAYVCNIINEMTKGKFPREHHVVWIGKTKHTS